MQSALEKPDKTEHELNALQYVELLFFAYRDFVSEPDKTLENLGFGRAHHRVLHFVARHPGMRVADLLEVLKITKQSLARVLRHLIDDGYIVQKESSDDRRARLLYVTPQGLQLADDLAAPQKTRIAAALNEAGPNAPEIIRNFLYNMTTPADRAAIHELVKGLDDKAGPPALEAAE